MIFVDTSALYAFVDASDARHAAIRVEFECLLESGVRLAASDYVLVETLALVQARLGMQAVRLVVADLLPEMEILPVGADALARALSALLAAGRRKLSLVDCSSFELMRGHGIREVLTLDRHFTEAGFVVRPVRES